VLRLLQAPGVQDRPGLPGVQDRRAQRRRAQRAQCSQCLQRPIPQRLRARPNRSGDDTRQQSPQSSIPAQHAARPAAAVPGTTKRAQLSPRCAQAGRTAARQPQQLDRWGTSSTGRPGASA
jgi:hypothetical protein